ncbi:MAG: hypothetical protein ACR2H3_09590, partial [Acidimicrobiales bacterium]
MFNPLTRLDASARPDHRGRRRLAAVIAAIASLALPLAHPGPVIAAATSPGEVFALGDAPNYGSVDGT